MMYLSRPHSAPTLHSADPTFPLEQTFAMRYIPTYKRYTRPDGIKEEIFDIQQVPISKSAIPTQLGLRLDAEPNHDHYAMLNLPSRDAYFRNMLDYFEGGSSMVTN
ncbi:unnamed protein product [Didymodactylos carnosus]|nr:unnamed protein product [Didymodactylos carnosus]CAF4497424.1 unnamed protein product [Didymodactylos carnosus]